MLALSYILTTRNKLDSLRAVLERLVAAKQFDEEILVIDGASTDGTKEYLEGLFQAGKIDQYLSEQDWGESHGFNKGLLMARGELVKVITDDDYFFYPAIQVCKQFMLEHPEVDLLATNGGKKTYAVDAVVGELGYVEAYQAWSVNRTPFAFCGLGLLFRRRSLPLTGLFDPQYVKVDAEFGLRVTSGKTNLAWYTGKAFVHIANPNGNTIKKHRRIYEETLKLDYIYFGKRPSIKERAIRVLSALAKRALGRDATTSAPAVASGALFSACDAWYREKDPNRTARFLLKDVHEL